MADQLMERNIGRLETMRDRAGEAGDSRALEALDLALEALNAPCVDKLALLREGFEAAWRKRNEQQPGPMSEAFQAFLTQRQEEK